MGLKKLKFKKFNNRLAKKGRRPESNSNLNAEPRLLLLYQGLAPNFSQSPLLKFYDFINARH